MQAVKLGGAASKDEAAAQQFGPREEVGALHDKMV